MTSHNRIRVDYGHPLINPPHSKRRFKKLSFFAIPTVVVTVALGVVMAKSHNPEPSPEILAANINQGDDKAVPLPIISFLMDSELAPELKSDEGPDYSELYRTLSELEASQNQEDDPSSANEPDGKSLASPIPPSLPVSDGYKVATVKKGDSISKLMSAEGVSLKDLYKILKLNKSTAKLKHLKPGDQIKLKFDADKQLSELIYRINDETTLYVNRDGTDYKAKTKTLPRTKKIETAHGIVTDSLFLSAERSGLPQSLIMRMIKLFKYDIDFAMQVRKGDTFSVIYETYYQNDKKVKNGNILAAEYVNGKKVSRLIRYKRPDGKTDYYTPTGSTTRKAFVRNPMDIVRITSHFNLKRRHPVLHKIRAHKGVDYGAKRGTPIKATGDGRIAFIGRKGGYGKTIIIQHAGKYSTLFAHMSRYHKSMKKGKRVRQGQVIGYVGATGRVTGPHLHYEFRVNGKHVNPLKVRFPGANPIPRKYKADFKRKTAQLTAQLDKMRRQNLAQLGK